MKSENTSLAGAIVDELGRALAQRAEVTERCDALKADIIAMAADAQRKAFEGELFRATVSFADKVKTDWRAVVAELAAMFSVPADVQEGIIERYTQRAEGCPAVRVAARKGV